jgi:pimeloyl-ACP methyl ester carboxylesterase
MPDDLIIVVPGITGSVLARNGEPLWDLSVAALSRGLLHSSDVLAAMALPPTGDGAPESPAHVLEPVGLIAGWHIWPGFWKGGGYGALMQRLKQAAPGRVLAFPYDWRLSNMHTARLLRDFTERALQDRPGAKVTFVCHSMGGLIARYYLEVLGGRHLASQLITIGTPYSGSVKAIRALAGGLIPSLSRVSDALTGVARTFPSVAELLPAYRCAYTSSDTGPRLLHGLQVPDLPTGLVGRGRDFHDQISAAIAANGTPTYPVHAFAGKLQPTDQSILISNATLAYRRHQRGTDHAGDGTVAAFSAVPPEWDTTGNAIYRAARHGPLTKHRGLLDDVTDKINAVPLRGVLAPPYELALDLPDTAPAGQPVSVTVTSETVNLLLHASVRDLGGNVIDSRIPLYPDDSGGTYRAGIPLPAGTWHITVEEVTKTPRAAVDDIITLT